MRLDGKELLRTEDICLTFHPEDGIPVKAADHVSITIHEGETFGLVGESGSGKSTLARILTHIHQPDSGKVYFEGIDVTNLKGKALRESRRAIQMVFQDPSSAFNPKERIADIICEPLMNFGLIASKDIDKKAAEMLKKVDLPEDFINRYPSELSGGQRQRIAIARALVLKPKLIICDEATSALDMSVQKTIIELLSRLQKETGVAYLFICHDLALANLFCDTIAVMKKGVIHETIHDLNEAKDPYSRKLLACTFTIREGKNKVFPESLFA